jgi:hypothetical protein
MSRRDTRWKERFCYTDPGGSGHTHSHTPRGQEAHKERKGGYMGQCIGCRALSKQVSRGEF